MKTLLRSLAFLAIAVAIVSVWYLLPLTRSQGIPVATGTRARGDIEALGTALKMYGAEVYDFPTTEQGLQALIEKPVIEPIPRKWEQQMEAPILDPWGRPYVYRYRGWWNRSDEQYELFSLGEDGVESADDIGEKHPK